MSASLLILLTERIEAFLQLYTLFESRVGHEGLPSLLVRKISQLHSLLRVQVVRSLIDVVHRPLDHFLRSVKLISQLPGPYILPLGVSALRLLIHQFIVLICLDSQLGAALNHLGLQIEILVFKPFEFFSYLVLLDGQ